MARVNQRWLAVAVLALLACGKSTRRKGGSGDVRPPHKGDLASCADSLTGTWRAKDDPRYRYDVADHGDTIEVRPESEKLPDGGHPSWDYVFTIHRAVAKGGPAWPTGTLRFEADAPDSRDGGPRHCAIQLGARITGCEKQGFVLASKQNGKMDWDACQVEELAQWNETPLVRAE